MQPSSKKFYEVERIAAKRQSQGKEEFLVFWKGYDSYSATWEPTENLTFCKQLVQKFNSKISPIPGGIPCNVSELKPKIKPKTKTISVKMLLAKKRKQSRSKSLSVNDSNHGIDKLSKSKSKHLSETEKLIRDTLLHESKSMVPKKASLAMVNNLINFDNNNKNNKRNRSINGYTSDFNGESRKRKADSVISSEEEYEESSTLSESLPAKCSSKQTLRDAGEGDHIICQKEDNCMKITLNNTARHNVLTTNMMESITHCLQSAQKDAGIRAVLLRNNSDHFCSGIDYSELTECSEKQYKEKAVEICEAVRSLTEILIHFKKPILTAVNGICMDFGISFVVLGDLTFTSSRTNFELNSSKLGLAPMGCLTYLLPKLVGPTMANSMFFLGESFRATAAYDRGLINDIYGIHSFQEDIEKRLNQLISNQTQFLEQTKSMLRDMEIETLENVCKKEMIAYRKCLCSEQCRRKLQQDWTVTINLYGSI